ncbi:MAG: glycosyltransferase family 4 protein [Bacteroidia bacterium]|nr:glycosyltransferase family 4 protein [Bacteroidia bacterium]
MKGNLHSIFFCSWYPNRIEPTAGNFIQKHAEAVALYCNVTTLCICSDSNMIADIETECFEQNGVYSINIYYKKVSSQIPVFSSLQKAYRYYKAFKTGYNLILKRRSAANIIHVNKALPIGFFAVLIKVFSKIPFVVTEHWTAYSVKHPNALSFFEKYTSRFIFNKADMVMPVSDDLGKEIKKLGVHTPFIVIPNVVDVHKFPIVNGYIKNRKQLLHISTAKDEQKNISGLLRVIEKLSKKRQDFYLMLISDGFIEPHLNYSKELGILNKFVFFEPTKTTNEVAVIMQQSDIFVLFSNYENFPCVIPEALSSGLPVISTNVNGIPEHINDSNGILINTGDENALGAAIEKILDDNAPFDAGQLHNYATEHFSYEVVGKRYYDVYCSILK